MKKSIIIILVTALLITFGIFLFDRMDQKLKAIEFQNLLNSVEQDQIRKENDDKLNQLQEDLTLNKEALELAKAETAELKARKPQIIVKEKTIENNNGIDVAKIVAEWNPKIVKIICDFGLYEQTGSGTIDFVNDVNKTKTIVWTNKHVVELNSYAPDFCNVILLNGEIISVVYPNIRIDKILDKAALIISDEKIGDSFNGCEKDNPAIGDPVVIIGYPTIGSSTSVTVTEGIISGYDGDYYVTSAKVEQGNSGGAAIDVKRNCWLGIPTFGIKGQLESLSRILSYKTLFNEL